MWLQQLETQMKEKRNFKRGLHLMQELSGKSPEHLSRTFKKYFDKSPTDFINELRLNYARNMLEHSDTSIIDISIEAGFDNLSHFYHLFKNQYHISPRAFRKAGVQPTIIHPSSELC